MPYDYERKVISKATGLTGVEAEHIAQKLKEENIDPQTIDWHGAISDARDYGSRYAAVKKYLADYYGISLITTGSMPDIIPESYDIPGLESQAATKKGVKNLLKDYYATDSKQKKEEIKNMLLTDAPLHNVLMTAMYNGVDLPNARRFLNEVMKEEVISFVKAPVTREIKIEKIVEKPVVEEVVKEVAKKPVVIPRTGLKPEPKPEPKPVAMKDIDVRFLKEMDKQIKGPEKKPTLTDVIKAGIVKEGKTWKKLLTQSVKPRKGSMATLRGEVYRLRMENLPLQLQLQKQRLLMQREQMQHIMKATAQQQRRSSVQQALSLLGFIPPQQQQPTMGPQRPGYYIEARPKLPVGFRWKKIPKSKAKGKQPVSNVGICAKCGIPMIMMPNMFGQLIWKCPKCGGSQFESMYV